MKQFLGHLKTVLIHKWWVFYYCCKAKIIWRGIIHDLSKFSIIEFKESCQYYKGDGISPINHCKSDKGYSLAWQHHRGRNAHHYEYWIDYLDDGGIPIKMPYKDLIELICDWLAAGKAYNGTSFNFVNEYKWWETKKASNPKIHNDTITFIETIFWDLSKGLKFNRKLFDRAKECLNY